MTSITFNAAGKVPQPSAQELALADQEMAILCYVQGSLQDGRRYYAYVAVTPSKYQEFREATTAHKELVIGHYGAILAAGFGSEPPADVVQDMHETYGFDDQYEATLKLDAIKERDAFFEAQEKTRVDNALAILKAKAKGKP